MSHQFKHPFHRGEFGFTLIELLIGAALLGSIISVAGIMLYQIIAIPQASNNHLQAILIVENVGQWIIRDGKQAQTVDISQVSVSGGTRKLRLVWDYSQYSQGKHTIDYIVQNDNKLRRDDYVNGSPTALSTIIGENITTFSVAGQYQVTVGATTGGFMSKSAQLVYSFKPKL